MRIGIVAPFHQCGGSEFQILLLVRGLLECGIHVQLFHFHIQDGALTERLRALRGLETYSVAVPGFRSPVRHLREVVALASVVRKTNVDLLHCWNYSGHIVGGIAARLAGVPALYAVRGLDPWKKPWHIPFYRLINRLATGFVFQSMRTRDIVCCRERIRSKRIFVIPNGVDEQRFRPAGGGEPRARLLSDLRRNGPMPGGWDEGGLDARALALILSVGSLRRVKGYDVLIEAVRTLRSSEPGCRFHVVIAGEGPQRCEYEQRAEGLPISIVGFRDDPEALYNAVDIYCQPSRSEAMPNSVIEAMRCGLPVVASGVGAVGDLVTEGNGRLVAPGDPAALARALAGLLRNRAAWPAMRRASLSASQCFGATKMVEAYVSLYQSVSAR